LQKAGQDARKSEADATELRLLRDLAIQVRERDKIDLQKADQDAHKAQAVHEAKYDNHKGTGGAHERAMSKFRSAAVTKKSNGSSKSFGFLLNPANDSAAHAPAPAASDICESCGKDRTFHTGAFKDPSTPALRHLFVVTETETKANDSATHANDSATHAPGSLQKAMGEVRGVNGMNTALWALGMFKHEPPKFDYFDPELSEHLEVLFKEVRLPRAEQTHEVIFEPLTKCIFISQMSNSVLVRIPVADGGLLLDDQDAWRVGPMDSKGEGLGGLHNISLSMKHPGCLWVSLQFCNELLLVEAATMKLRFILKVPTMLVRTDSTAIRVGGPHCIRECPHTGEIWVALKGSVACHPAETPDRAKATGTFDSKSLARAKQRVCCSAKALAERMAKLEELGYDAPPPEGFAVWRVDPNLYNPNAEDGYAGGKLYECEPSPPMLAIDNDGNCWSAQDQSPNLCMINARTHEVEQIDVPHPMCLSKADMRITGPSIDMAPDGSIW
jgi:hypothetical protein